VNAVNLTTTHLILLPLHLVARLAMRLPAADTLTSVDHHQGSAAENP
jgi:hypothetical protein